MNKNNLLLVLITLFACSCRTPNINKGNDLRGFELDGLKVKRMNLLFHGQGDKFEYIFLDLGLGDNYARKYCLLIKNKFSKLCKIKKDEYFIREENVNIPIENKNDLVIGYRQSVLFFIDDNKFTGKADLKFIVNGIVDFVIPLKPHYIDVDLPTGNESTGHH